MGNSSTATPKRKKPHTKNHKGYCPNKNRSNGEIIIVEPYPGQRKKDKKKIRNEPSIVHKANTNHPRLLSSNTVSTLNAIAPPPIGERGSTIKLIK